MKRFMNGAYDDNFYFNNPVDYLANLSDPWMLGQLASCDIHLATGTGPFEHSGEAYRLSEILAEPRHPASSRRLGPARRTRLAVLEASDARISLKALSAEALIANCAVQHSALSTALRVQTGSMMIAAVCDDLLRRRSRRRSRA